FDVKVRIVNLTAQSKVDLLRAEVTEGSADGLLHRPSYSAGRLKFSGAAGNGHFQPIQADRAVGADRARVDGTRCEWIGGNEIASTLLGHADELVFPGGLVVVAERRLVVLERSHLFELFLDAPSALYRVLDEF